MQVVQAGSQKLLCLELENDVIEQMAQQLNLECKLEDDARSLVLHLSAPNREGPLLLFDAADPGNLGWFSRCQFYVDGQTAAVLQTPFWIANVRDGRGHVSGTAVRIKVGKELPENFRLPGNNAINEQNIYAILFNFLNALLNTGVAVCGTSLVRPLAGRGDAETRG
jgi:hypothetical protein